MALEGACTWELAQRWWAASVGLAGHSARARPISLPFPTHTDIHMHGTAATGKPGGARHPPKDMEWVTAPVRSRSALVTGSAEV